MTLQPFLTKLSYRFGNKSRLFKIDEVLLYSLLAFIQAPGVPVFGIKKKKIQTLCHLKLDRDQAS